jgi:hypothetical protein
MQVTMCVDVDRGDLVYCVNRKECASLRDVGKIREGVYLAARMYKEGVEWEIVSAQWKFWQ